MTGSGGGKSLAKGFGRKLRHTLGEFLKAINLLLPRLQFYNEIIQEQRTTEKLAPIRVWRNSATPPFFEE